MCNLYSLTSNQEAMRRLFGVTQDKLGNFAPMPAIFPDAEAPVIVQRTGTGREAVRMRWGFPKVRHSHVTNIRNLSSNYWRGWLADPTYRVLVPASSFSEYHPTQRDSKGRKCASWFALNDDTEARPLFAFAGLWRPWRGERKKGETGEFSLFAFLTTEANDVVAPIHPKAMPVILDPADYDQWLTGSAEQAAALQRPHPPDRMRLVFTGEKQDDPAAALL